MLTSDISFLKPSQENLFAENFFSVYYYIMYNTFLHIFKLRRGQCGHDRMAVGFTTTCAISTYHH